MITDHAANTTAARPRRHHWHRVRRPRTPINRIGLVTVALRLSRLLPVG